jgi:hypothetical protein
LGEIRGASGSQPARHRRARDADSAFAGQLRRRRKAYADLEANDVVRARGKAAPILRDLETLERSILDGYKALALTPQAAASLNLTLRARLCRTKLRALLGLPANDCGARKPNPACTFLTATLDQLGVDADKATIVEAARNRHVKRPVRRWHQKATGRS